MGCIEL